MPTEAGYIRHHPYVDVIGDYLWIAEDAAGELYFPVRPTCDALGIGSQTALERIRQDARLYPGLCGITLPTAGGDQEQQCLASTEYSWWLALIDPRRFKPERRDLLIEKQRVLMGLARWVMLHRGELAEIRTARRARAQQRGRGQGLGADEAIAGMCETVSGELHMRCPVCHAPLCMPIDGARIVAGAELGE